MAEQQGRKERDLPHQTSRGAAAAVAERAVSPRAEEMQRQVCGGTGLASQGACRLQRPADMEHPEVPGGLVHLLGHVEMFQTLES